MHVRQLYATLCVCVGRETILSLLPMTLLPVHDTSFKIHIHGHQRLSIALASASHMCSGMHMCGSHARSAVCRSVARAALSPTALSPTALSPAARPCVALAQWIWSSWSWPARSRRRCARSQSSSWLILEYTCECSAEGTAQALHSTRQPDCAYHC